MNRLFRALLIAMLVGPQIGQLLSPVQDACVEERQDCCDSDGVCDVNCVRCACCSVRLVVVHNVGSHQTLGGPPAHPFLMHADSPPVAPSSDILHIPKTA
jgi:hypothetical protein